VSLAALEFARPGALWSLGLAPALLVLVRVLARPPEAVVGTLELWRRLPEARAGRAGRARFPPWALAAALALTAGALAWSGPRLARAPAPRTWTLVVDRSRSMGLPGAPGVDATRQGVALREAEALLAASAAPDDRVCWVSPGRATLARARGQSPPAEWLAPLAEGEVDWARFDRPGTVWLTDRLPDVPRLQAGLCASGGSEVPGAVGLDGGANLWWEGGTLERRPRARPLAVRIREPAGARLPAVFERAVAAWSQARGLVLTREAANEALFTLALVPGPAAAAAVAFGRDGWGSSGRAAPLPVPADPEVEWQDWLRAEGDGAVLARVASGRIELALHSAAEPSGDPAAFALSCARLFERAAVLPADIVPLDERLAAGERARVPGAPPPAPLGSAEGSGPARDAGLALFAALAAGAALLLRGRA
jgi:hypothetical protein